VGCITSILNNINLNSIYIYTGERMTKELSVEQMSALYDRIYNIADRLIKKHNPCGIQIKDNKVVCRFTTHKKDTEFFKYGYYGTEKLCCVHCNAGSKGHWGKNGCTTKCLACKLFWCPAVTNKVIKKRLQLLHNYASIHLAFYTYSEGYKHRYSIVCEYYVSKEDWLKLLKESRSEKTHRATAKA